MCDWSVRQHQGIKIVLKWSIEIPCPDIWAARIWSQVDFSTGVLNCIIIIWAIYLLVTKPVKIHHNNHDVFIALPNINRISTFLEVLCLIYSMLSSNHLDIWHILSLLTVVIKKLCFTQNKNSYSPKIFSIIYCI